MIQNDRISLEYQIQYRDKIIESIVKELTKDDLICQDLSDIGNIIGIAVGNVTCQDQKDKNIPTFEKEDFEYGFQHGYSLRDGSH